jgi:stearoyl-CoA desaturase (delta-9 desaturase)
VTPETAAASAQPPRSAFGRFANATMIMFRQWWDSDFHPEGAEVVMQKEDKMDVKRTMPFIILHGFCLLVFFVGWSWFAFFAAIAFYYFRMFAITAFYHRYFSHRAYKTSRLGQFIFAVIGNTACQRGALWWASTHRHHHKHSDDEHDIHSPRHKGFWWSHIGWITSHRNFPTDYTRIKDLAKYPELVFLNRHDFFIPIILGASIYGVGWLLETYAPFLHVTAMQLFVWCFFVSTVALMHGTFFINSLAHVFGRRRFKTTDDSRNSLTLALITLGEGWHNNHHRYQHSARQGFYWWELDVSYYVLKVLSWLGIVWDLKPVPASIYKEAEEQQAASH